MKKPKKLLVLFLTILLILSSSLIYGHNVKAATTIGDTSVGVDVGDVFTWIVTEVNETNAGVEIGDMVQYQIIDISENLIPGSLALNISTRQYVASFNIWAGYWNIISNGSIEWYYNATSPEINGFNSSNLFIVPIPLDVYQLSYIIGLIGDTGTVVGTNGLNCTGPGVSMAGHDSIYYIFNSNGIATSITYRNGSDVMYVLTLVLDGITDNIYGVKVGDVLTYEYTEINDAYSIPFVVGDKYEFTIDSISNLLKGFPSGYAIINMTFRIYNKTEELWHDSPIPGTFTGYNPLIKTIALSFNPILLPVPLDILLICEILNDTEHGATAWCIGTDGLFINQYPYTSYLSYNLDGTATSVIIMYNNEILSVMTLETSSEPEPEPEPNHTSIPLGMSFLIFGALTIITLVIIVKKRNIFSMK